jgi:hypothetical protein
LYVNGKTKEICALIAQTEETNSMGKIAPEPLIPQRTHGRRSYWVRNLPAAAKDDPDATEAHTASKGLPKSPSTKKRFVEPYRLSDAQRAAMVAPLAEGRIGDPESRELFAAALAYDLATCYDLMAASPDGTAAPAATETAAAPAGRAPGKTQGRKTARTAVPAPALAELADVAKTLAARLDGLEGAVRTALLHGLAENDPFHRGYDEAYLAALRGELMRIALCTGAKVPVPGAEQPAPLAKPPTPKPSPAARQFIARAAGAFEECFDQAPTAQVGGPFAAMLKALATATGLRIPTDARTLADLLGRG